MRILSIPSLPDAEHLVIDELISIAKEDNIRIKRDEFGNLYLIKGILDEDERYPVLVAHMDTVHDEHEVLIKNNQKLEIRNTNGILRAYYPNSNIQTGIGGDDKAGIVIALEVLKKLEKGICAFFRMEEVGCIGSKNLDIEIMGMGGYAIEFDAPTGSEISIHCDGIRLFDNNFLNSILPTLSKFGYSDFVEHRPYTDVARIRELLDYNTINMGAGYHMLHTNREYCVVAEMENAVDCALYMIEELGNRHHKFNNSINKKTA